MYYAKYLSPVGQILLTCTEDGLTGAWLNREAPEQEDDHPVLEQAKRWLEDYFRGQPREVDFPFAPEGTPFQKQVWEILLTIPFGQTRTYGSIAREIARLTGKDAMSAQAVGQAVGKNPIGILIPCHRVMGAGGKLTGYAAGLDRKRWLLEHEQKSAGR